MIAAKKTLKFSLTPCSSQQWSTSLRSLSTIGFIGLGNMGQHMALNLLKYKQKVILYDVNEERCKNVVEQARSEFGPDTTHEIAPSIPALAQSAEVVITMLPETQHVKSVLENGLLNGLQPGSLLIDCSTIDPGLSREFHEQVASVGSCMVDAPVSGGVVGAKAGTLTFMAGGKLHSISRAEPMLNLMGKKVIYCGGPGLGEAAKLCNNLSLAISMIATAEALALGRSLGMDPKVLSDVMNISSARCWSSEVYSPCPGVMDGVPSANGYEGGFATDLMRKDLRLAIAASKLPTGGGDKEAHTSDLPMGQLAYQLYSKLSEKGYGGKDFSSIFKLLAKEIDG